MNEKRFFEDAVEEICTRLAETLISKQRDYGGKSLLDFGELGVLVRANDKMSRLKNLLGNSLEPKNEVIEDSWMDLAGYSVLALLLRSNQMELPMKNVENE